ncbi:hypothetical protein [Sporichthya sp.]|uniref:hypothetical protein n=1 Tax=Sporichthya sp. TaxID=65475 RepID=UPI0018191BD7|nr:hypothetical protein [Sporichthya sp.]MBA3741819.1 hypothetical protein [Sporichthya sp.]
MAALVLSASGGAAWAVGAFDTSPLDIAGGLGGGLAARYGDFVQGSGGPSGQGVLTYTATVTLKAGSNKPRLSDITMTVVPVDVHGNAIGPGRVLLAGSANLNPAWHGKKAPLNCRCTGPKRKGVTRTQPTRMELDTEVGTLDLTSMFASFGHTRYVDAANASQVLGCVASGTSMDEDYRLLQAGAGLAHRDAVRTDKLGMGWSSGEPEALTTEGAPFPLGFSTNSGIVGTVRQGPGGRLTGSFLPPAENPTEPFARNAAYAWWEIAEDCLDESPCSGHGDRSFHGATGNAAWIIHEGSPQVFVITGYARYACTKPTAPACT